MTERPKFEVGTTYYPPEEGGKSLEQYEDILGFDSKNLENKDVMDLGSGEDNRFAKGIEKLGINARVVSVNPDYIHDKHLRKRKNKRAVAAIAQALPFKDGSFDFVVALESVTRYIKPEEATKWASEVVRVLKNGGEARLWPILEMDEKEDRDRKDLDKLIGFLESLGVEVSLEKWTHKDVAEINGYRMVIKKLQKEG